MLLKNAKIFRFVAMGNREVIISDKDLWKEFISGDNEAFQAIYEKYFPDLFKYGCYFSDDRDLVMDCIQDLFVNLHDYRSKLKPTDKIRPYLIASFKQNIFKKISAVSHQKKKTMPIENLAFNYSFMDNQENDMDDDRMAILKNALNGLTARQKEAIYLKYVTGLGYDELSASMNISYQASRNLVFHAMERLRRAVAEKAFLLWSIINHGY
jgi:RNA polymerase sigma-70 factor (ECF subfamily)